MSTETTPVPDNAAARAKRTDRCCTCGRPRGLAQRRSDWGLNCPTVIVPRTGNPEDKPWQITNDLICNAGIWRNGGSDETTHICDDCIRIGLRHIKLKVDELLGTLEAGRDKDQELAALTQRLGLLQFEYQSLAFAHNRMQSRLADALKLLPAPTADKSETARVARWEVSRGPVKIFPDETETDPKRTPVYRALTVQALRIYVEVWSLGGMNQKHFAREYLNGLGDYERQIAKEEGIELPES